MRAINRKYLNLVAGLSLGFAAAESSFAATLAQLGYTTDARNLPKPADFYNVMSKGVKIDKAKHGCSWATRAEIFAFEDGVVYTDTNRNDFNSFSIETVKAKGCSIPVRSSLIEIPSTTLQPVALDKQVVLDGSIAYNTVSLAGTGIAGLSVNTKAVAPTNTADFITKVRAGVQLTQSQFGCKDIAGTKIRPFIFAFLDGVILTETDGKLYDVYDSASVKAAGCQVPATKAWPSNLVPTPPDTKPAPALASLATNLKGTDFSVKDSKDETSMDLPDYEVGGLKIDSKTLGCNVSQFPIAYVFSDAILFTDDVFGDDETYHFDIVTRATAEAAGCKLSQISGNTGGNGSTTPTPGTAAPLYSCKASPVAQPGLVGAYAKGAFETGSMTENRAFAFVSAKAGTDVQRGIDLFNAKAAILQENLTLLPDVHSAVNLANGQSLLVGNFAAFVEIFRSDEVYTVREYNMVVDFSTSGSKAQIRLKSEYPLKALMNYSFNPWKQDFEQNRIESFGFGILHNAQGEIDLTLKYPRAGATSLVNGWIYASSLDKVASTAKLICNETWNAIRFSGEALPFCDENPAILNGSAQPLTPVTLGARVDKQFAAPVCATENPAAVPTNFIGTYENRLFGNEYKMINEQNSTYEPFSFYRQYFVVKGSSGNDLLGQVSSAYKYALNSRTTMVFDAEKEVEFKVGEAYVIGYIENGELFAIAIEQTAADQFKESVIKAPYKGEPTVSSASIVSDWANDVNMYLRASVYNDGTSWRFYEKLESYR